LQKEYELSQWVRSNTWAKSIPFKVAFRIGGGLGDMLHTAATGHTFTRIKSFKEIFKSCKIVLWVNSHDEKIATDLWSTSQYIDEVLWRQEETIFRGYLREFFGKNMLSDWTNLPIYDTNPWEMVYNNTRFKESGGIPIYEFLRQVHLPINLLLQEEFEPKCMPEDIEWGIRNIPNMTVGISFFSSHKTIDIKVWKSIIKKLLANGLNVAFFGNEYERRVIKVDKKNRSLSAIANRAWKKGGLGIFYKELIESNMTGIIDLVGKSNNIRQTLVAMKQCIGHITVNSGLCNVPWLYRIPSVMLFIKSAKMTNSYVHKENGYFWGVTNPDYVKPYSTRIIIPEANITKDISDSIVTDLMRNISFIHDTKR